MLAKKCVFETAFIGSKILWEAAMPNKEFTTFLLSYWSVIFQLELFSFKTAKQHWPFSNYLKQALISDVHSHCKSQPCIRSCPVPSITQFLCRNSPQHPGSLDCGNSPTTDLVAGSQWEAGPDQQKQTTKVSTPRSGTKEQAAAGFPSGLCSCPK